MRGSRFKVQGKNPSRKWWINYVQQVPRPDGAQCYNTEVLSLHPLILLKLAVKGSAADAQRACGLDLVPLGLGIYRGRALLTVTSEQKYNHCQ
jgi:hypothetical protein